MISILELARGYVKKFEGKIYKIRMKIYNKKPKLCKCMYVDQIPQERIDELWGILK